MDPLDLDEIMSNTPIPDFFQPGPQDPMAAMFNFDQYASGAHPDPPVFPNIQGDLAMEPMNNYGAGEPGPSTNQPIYDYPAAEPGPSNAAGYYDPARVDPSLLGPEDLETLKVRRSARNAVKPGSPAKQTSITHFFPTSGLSKRKAESGDDEFVPNSKLFASKPGNKRMSKAKILPSLENATMDKPEPFGEPPVWASKRQQLCDALDYYKAHEGAAYTKNKIVHGFLANQGVGNRDKFTEDVYITKVGGGKELDDDGTTKQLKDQHHSLIAEAFQNNMKKNFPVAMIAGQRNPLSPCKLIHHFNVLGWFHVTDVWCEKNAGLKVWMVRLEKIDLTCRSWWSPRESIAHLQQGYDGVKTSVTTCSTCQTPSKTIYNQGWACRNPDCRKFFDFGFPINDRTLDYNSDFLLERTRYTGKPPGPLRPEPVTDADLASEDAFGVEERCKRGIVCSKCHCCMRRLEWHQWSCENQDCDFTHSVTQLPVPIGKVMRACKGNRPRNPMELHPSVEYTWNQTGPYDVYTITLPGEGMKPAGTIQVFRANDLINSQPGGPNDMFQDMQKSDFKLRRNPSRHSGLPLEIVTAHFASNWGAPYKYSVAQATNAFSDAPAPLLKAIQRMTWAGQEASVGQEWIQFNEALVLGYFESMHIGYHDDGESTLGPAVATISLGASSTMLFRPKNSSNIEGVIKARKGSKKNKSPYAKLTLNHGDIIFMNGHGIHKYYEHSVEPHGLLRFAVTCRYVRPELLNAKDQALCAVKSQFPPDFANYAYDGDVNAEETNAQEPEIEEPVAKKAVAKKTAAKSTFAKNLSSIETQAAAGGLSASQIADLQRVLELANANSQIADGA